jgi:hypothetical protein
MTKGWKPFSPPKINEYRIQREMKKMDIQIQTQQNKGKLYQGTQ